jgi:chemotaxis protein methyltransferase CheR
VTPEAFNALARFVKRRSGISLPPAKRALAARKLEPVVARFGFKATADLVDELAAPSTALARDVIAAMTTNDTSFFRDRAVFDHFRKEIFPALLNARADARRVRIWCAAASTGQEAYSLAMIVDEFHAVLKGWTVEILASDIAADAIARARDGRYGPHEVERGLSRDMLIKHFRPDNGDWRVDKALRGRVAFGVRNLSEPFADLGTFDLILCRNVLIYFDAPTKQGVLNRLHSALASDGYLVLGSAETLLGFGGAFEPAGVKGIFANARPSLRRLAAG